MLKDFQFKTDDLEADEELTFCAWAENNGWVTRKFEYVGRRGAADRIVMGHGQIFLIEFKRDHRLKSKRGKLSQAQETEKETLSKVGITVHVFYTSNSAIAFLRSQM